MASQAEPLSGLKTFQRRIEHGDLPFRYLTMFFGLLVILLVVAIGWVVWDGSAEARAEFGFGFLFQEGWNPVNNNYGAWPAIYGTLASSGIALLIAGPLGVLIGVFLSELCPFSLRMPLSFLVELLAAIPSVIYGMWGIFVFIPFFVKYIAIPITDLVGNATTFPLSLLSAPQTAPVTSGRGIMIAGIILAIMILPTIAAISRDVLVVVPNHQREALLAVGATRWEMIWKGVISYARAGIVGGMMLGLGRALGETMAALMVIGSLKKTVESSLFAPGISAAALVASELPNADSSLHASTLILIALVLFGITLLLNAAARLLVWHVSRGPGGNVRA
ncbi:MAG: phosphate ABC transporter permease subunit PstC [Chloroflexaceae bacterium]|nr:phosphate ABC transporter permease subunit PstC [Chloroflexaceae bacterium]